MRVHKPILVRPASEPKNSINVTPLVDVVLVLLIIFMVVMPLLEKDFSVRIPANEQVEAASDVPDQIVVEVASSGAFTIDGAATSPEAYVQALKGRLDPRAPADRVVFVTSHDDASYKKLVEAFDGARKAGAQTLGMLAAPPSAAGAAAATAPPTP
ncbi:MAG TPA: biopolymer transporter ExbD [Polyangiales bacterium]